MKAIYAALVLTAALSSSAFAQWDSGHKQRGGCAGELLGSCEEYENGEKVGPNNVMCIARDSANVKYTAVGSYGRPTHENVQKAVDACRARSAHPSTCHWTACVWAD